MGRIWVHGEMPLPQNLKSSEGPGSHPAQYPLPHPHTWLTSVFLLCLAVCIRKFCLSQILPMA